MNTKRKNKKILMTLVLLAGLTLGAGNSFAAPAASGWSVDLKASCPAGQAPVLDASGAALSPTQCEPIKPRPDPKPDPKPVCPEGEEPVLDDSGAALSPTQCVPVEPKPDPEPDPKPECPEGQEPVLDESGAALSPTQCVPIEPKPDPDPKPDPKPVCPEGEEPVLDESGAALSPTQCVPVDPDEGIGFGTPVYQFYNHITHAHFYTISKGERDYVIEHASDRFKYEGPKFRVETEPIYGSSPVYRFYNEKTQVHFYTISNGEKDYLEANNPTYRYEGIAWYAYRTPPEGIKGLKPVFRYWNSKYRSHFYTISAGAAAYLDEHNPDYAYEGIAYYTWPIGK